MKDKAVKFFEQATYWSIVFMPFAVGISPGLANIFIGFFCAFSIMRKLLLRQRIFVSTPVNLAFTAVILTSLISFVHTVDVYASFMGIVKLLKYALIFLICAEEIRDAQHIRRIVFSAAVGASLVSIDSVWQLLSGKDFIHGNEVQSCMIKLSRPTASFPNPNVLGVYLSVLTPLFAGLALFFYRGRARAWMIIAGGLSALGVLLTLSRGSGVAVYAVLLGMAVVKKRKFLLAFLLGGVLLFSLFMPKNIKDWARDINYNPLVFMCNYDRISIYRNTLNMIEHHPLVGVGVNTFSKNYGQYKFPETGLYKTSDTIYAHNNFLHLAGETGLLGLAAFLWFLFLLFEQGIKNFRKLQDKYLKTVAFSVLFCLAAFLINGLTETNLYYPRVVMIFWYLAGLSLAMRKFIHEKSA